MFTGPSSTDEQVKMEQEVGVIEFKEEVDVVEMEQDEMSMKEEVASIPLVDSGLSDTAYPQIVVNKMPRVRTYNYPSTMYYVMQI
jgi:hypothetical protein